MYSWKELEQHFRDLDGSPHAVLDVNVVLPVAGGRGVGYWRLAGVWADEAQRRFKALADVAGRKLIEEALSLSDAERSALTIGVRDDVARRGAELIAAGGDRVRVEALLPEAAQVLMQERVEQRLWVGVENLPWRSAAERWYAALYRAGGMSSQPFAGELAKDINANGDVTHRSWSGSITRPAALSATLCLQLATRFEPLASEAVVATPEAAEIAAAGDSPNVCRREGATWLVRFEGKSVTVRHSLGMTYIAALLAAPGQKVSALELRAGRGTGTPTVLGSLGEVFDKKGAVELKARLNELGGEIAKAERDGDMEQAARLTDEREELARTVGKSTRRDGKIRPLRDEAERARDSVGKALRTAIEAIHQVHPALGRHLAKAISPGANPVYEPGQGQPPIRWDV